MTLIVGILWVARDFLIPLAITGLLFILSSALVDKIRRSRLFGWSPPNWLAQILSVAVIIGALLLLGLIVSSSADDLQSALPRYRERLTNLIGKIEGLLGPRLVDAGHKAAENVEIGSWLGAAVGQFGGVLSTLGLVALYLAFLVSERLAWMEKLPRLVASEEEAQRTQNILTRISIGVKQYMWVNAVTSAMSGVVAFVIFSWVGLDFAPLLALTVFVAGFIPNIGAFIGIALPSLVALIQFDSLTPFLIVLFGYGAADQFIANVIQPSMQGKSLNLSTFMVMVSLTFWATLWGGIGAFLAIPLMVVTMVVCSEIPATRWLAVLLSSDGQLQDGQSAEPKNQKVDSEKPVRRKRSKEQQEFDEELEQLRAEFEGRDR
ncbi:AI-2E family transporter [Primorskyibacter sp. S87]|uniref:AI-2E family transporter n=1 Tax=Primorskyibacter sp. S87 TaxID=3415126 RepID=UPI003C7C561B